MSLLPPCLPLPSRPLSPPLSPTCLWAGPILWQAVPTVAATWSNSRPYHTLCIAPGEKKCLFPESCAPGPAGEPGGPRTTAPELPLTAKARQCSHWPDLLTCSSPLADDYPKHRLRGAEPWFPKGNRGTITRMGEIHARKKTEVLCQSTHDNNLSFSSHSSRA